MTHIKTILRLSLVLCIIICAVIAIVKMQNRSCSGVQVVIDYNGENEMLTETDVIQLISKNQIKTNGEKLKEIKLESIKKLISNEIYVQKINKIYFSGTKLVIDISLREILLHVFSLTGDSFFIDNEGYMIPFSPKIQEKLIIVNGNITHKYSENKLITEKKSSLNSIYQIAKLLQMDPFYDKNFKQFFLNKDNIIELIPIDGSVTILFGDENDADEKLIKLKEIYNSVLPFSANKKYSLIDVRFKNRVIAKKANI